MLISGLISIFQIIFIPGFIIVNLIKIKTDTTIQKWLYIFSFSLFFNYALVTILTLLSIYTYFSMWGIFITEVLLITIFCKDELKGLFTKSNFSDSFNRFYIFFKESLPANRIIISIFFAIILFYSAVFFANIGTIFYFVDTVNNYEWNNWAIDFANNILPKYSSHFPQLLPANWSINYIMIGKTDVHFFPKAIMPLFFINNLLIFVDLAFTKKNLVFLLGLIIYGFCAPLFFSLVFIADGNADLPVSFFAFMTFYSLIKAKENNFNINSFIIVFAFASMSAATKLAGLYTFVAAVITIGIIILLNRKTINIKNLVKLFVFALVICGLSLFWYFISPGEMISGLHQPEYLSKTNYFNIAVQAVKMIYYSLGLPVVVFFIITLAASLFNNKTRYVTIIMVIIPTTIWMFKHSVDFRNLSFVIPFLSLISAAGLEEILKYFNNESGLLFPQSSLLKKTNSENVPLNRKTKILLLSIISISIILLPLFFSDKFNLFLLNIYEFFHKYYFQSYRIIYFIEYGFLLHVDYYQRVFIAASIILIILPVFIIIKARFNYVFLLLTVAVVFLNFTLIKEQDILVHQKNAFDKVDVRNYTEWLRIIVKNGKFKNEIITNFEEISKDKKPGGIQFEYVRDITEKYFLYTNNKTLQLFLKIKLLNQKTKDFLKYQITNKKYKLIFSTYDYVFLLNQSS